MRLADRSSRDLELLAALLRQQGVSQLSHMDKDPNLPINQRPYVDKVPTRPLRKRPQLAKKLLASTYDIDNFNSWVEMGATPDTLLSSDLTDQYYSFIAADFTGTGRYYLQVSEGIHFNIIYDLEHNHPELFENATNSRLPIIVGRTALLTNGDTAVSFWNQSSSNMYHGRWRQRPKIDNYDGFIQKNIFPILRSQGYIKDDTHYFDSEGRYQGTVTNQTQGKSEPVKYYVVEGRKMTLSEILGILHTGNVEQRNIIKRWICDTKEPPFDDIAKMINCEEEKKKRTVQRVDIGHGSGKVEFHTQRSMNRAWDEEMKRRKLVSALNPTPYDYNIQIAPLIDRLQALRPQLRTIQKVLESRDFGDVYWDLPNMFRSWLAGTSDPLTEMITLVNSSYYSSEIYKWTSAYRKENLKQRFMLFWPSVKKFKKNYDPDEYVEVAINKKVNVLVEAVKLYISAYKLVSKYIEGHYEEAQRRNKAYNEGVEQRKFLPETASVEVMYHVTAYADRILAEGFKSRDELGGAEALGGGPSDVVSFTSSLAEAKQIAKALREIIQISNGSVTLDQVLNKIKKTGQDVTKYSAWLNMLSGRRSEVDYAFDFWREYLAVTKNRYNPVFFGVSPDNFKHLKAQDVKIIAAEVDMSSVTEYLHAMNEWRVKPAGIKRIVRVL